MAGNLRSALDICRLVREHGRADRLLISTDTPTGTGVVPLGMFHLIAELVSLEGIPVELAIAAATGSVGRVYGLEAGLLEVGRPADLLVLDAPLGSAGDDWAGALQVGDLPGIGAAVTGGAVRYTKSRNTPAPKRPVRAL
jgi:enamidase